MDPLHRSLPFMFKEINWHLFRAGGTPFGEQRIDGFDSDMEDNALIEFRIMGAPPMSPIMSSNRDITKQKKQREREREREREIEGGREWEGARERESEKSGLRE